MTERVKQLVDIANDEFVRLGFQSLRDDQIECLADSTRHEEALDMIDDWQARLGFSPIAAAILIDMLNAELRDAQTAIDAIVADAGGESFRPWK